ncbi:MAG: pyridoxamine 5'-phosphate oxidase family protein [Methanocorpusculum sp.]|nr:pyridoxamine 5'-phosphate oxidase family protein [Methanocorpusculum sp.]
MDWLKEFFATVEREFCAVLATASGQSVTMRTVSPVYYEGRVLIFTSSDSVKYRQLRENPVCCVAAGIFFDEAKEEFLGPTMSDANTELRAAYCRKFPDAFTEGVPLGGREAEFILFTPFRPKGWAFEGGKTSGEGIPTMPFDAAV